LADQISRASGAEMAGCSAKVQTPAGSYTALGTLQQSGTDLLAAQLLRGVNNLFPIFLIAP
jgi:hypothetical protein